MKQARWGLVIDSMTLFIVSFTVVAYEIFLPRLFSVILDYSYVFLVVSLATLGVGLGGYISIRFMGRFDDLKHPVIGIYGLSIIAVTYTVYLFSYMGIFFYSILAFIPFLLSGWLVAGMMQQRKQEVSTLYFSDLLGAGFGAIGAVFLMNAIDPIRMIVFLSVILFLTFYLLSFRQVGYPMKVLNSAVLLLLMYNLYTPVVTYFEFNGYRTSPHSLFYNEPDAKIIYSMWNAFTRTDVYDADDEELLYITIDGGAVSPISKFSGDLKEVEYLRSTTSFLAFQGNPRVRALIIGAGGGQEVLAAQMTGFSNIEAVDINEASFRAVQQASEFSGDIFNKPNVKAIASDGRNHIRQTPNVYDLIYLSLVTKKSEHGLGFALTENFIYTREAIKEYLQKLTDQGRLSFLLHDEKELHKILFTASKVLREQGIPEDEIRNHVAVIGTYQHLGHVVMGMNGSKITRPLIMIQNKPFSHTAAAELFSSSKQIQQIPIHIPYEYDHFLDINDLLKNDQINVEANRDDMPFFYLNTSLAPWSLVVALLLIAAASIFIARKSKFPFGHTLYFSGIAVAFMLIEVTLIQTIILPLGHPTISFVFVLGTLLISGGVGSLFSRRLSSRRYVPMLCIGILTIGVHYYIGWMSDNAGLFSLSERLFLLGLALVPLGFFMGMPMPFGISLTRTTRVGISWGINGLMTVAGSLLAAILSLSFGFTFTLFTAAVVYILLFTFQPALKMG